MSENVGDLCILTSTVYTALPVNVNSGLRATQGVGAFPTLLLA